jgi:processive 1,2-diacylglycerol beta-glucosyltransferase
LLIRENPDFVISTHFLPSQLVSDLKKDGRIRSKLFTVITDFGVHPFWVSANTDIYIVASELTKEQLILKKIAPEKIMVLGIPIDAKFRVGFERSVLFKRLNLEEGKFTVLIVTGSFGIGPIDEIVDSLHSQMQLLVVCARNKGLFARLNRKKYPGVKVYGFVNNIEELMAVSDAIITKPGGLSLSETLAMELPPIFISPIPGQETENAKIMNSYGIGESAQDPAEIKNIISDYKTHPDKLNRVKENIGKVKKPSAAEGLYNVICQNSSGLTC